MREVIFAVILALASAAIVIGAADYSPGAAWIAAGALLAGWSWLVLGEIGDTR